MSIANTLKAIKRTELELIAIQEKYRDQPQVAQEMEKLQQSLDELENYLQQLDELKPNYNTNEINSFMQGIDLHLAILKEELAEKDYRRINNGIKLIKTMLKFHPTKYSFIAFLANWFLEWLYFI